MGSVHGLLSELSTTNVESFLAAKACQSSLQAQPNVIEAQDKDTQAVVNEVKFLQTCLDKWGPEAVKELTRHLDANLALIDSPIMDFFEGKTLFKNLIRLLKAFKATVCRNVDHWMD